LIKLGTGMLIVRIQW